uniref:Conodipine n=1 Tax=Conus ermineus TaxID=55423 RepID=A0A346CIN7_CONER|nr:conodipine [Conus ermineus]
MKLLAPVLWAMAALGVTWLVAVDSKESCTKHSNGCSTPLRLPCQEYFRPACDIHDNCYHCGKTFGISRGECDEAFLKDMTALCEKLGRDSATCPATRKRGVTSRRATSIAHSRLWTKALVQKSFLNRKAGQSIQPPTSCQVWAQNYHWAVKLAGASRYSGTTDLEACQGLEHCLPNH